MSTKSKRVMLNKNLRVPHGEKGDFLKVTITLPPDLYAKIMAEVTDRKISKKREPTVSAVLREAASNYLK